MIHDHGTALRCGHDGGYECAQAGKYDVGFLLKWAPKLYTCFCLLNYISPSCAAVVRCISKSKNSRRKCTDSMRLSNQPCPFHTIYCLPLMIKPCVAKLCCSVRLAYAIYCYRSAETPSTVKRDEELKFYIYEKGNSWLCAHYSRFVPSVRIQVLLVSLESYERNPSQTPTSSCSHGLLTAFNAHGCDHGCPRQIWWYGGGLYDYVFYNVRFPRRGQPRQREISLIRDFGMHIEDWMVLLGKSESVLSLEISNPHRKIYLSRINL